MQGTVSAFDADTRDGRVLLDDGVELAFPAEALEGSRLRFLRPGQRVRLETTGSGRALRVSRPADPHPVLTVADRRRTRRRARPLGRRALRVTW